MNRIIVTVITALSVPAVLFLYLYVTEKISSKKKGIKKKKNFLPWFWLFPGLLILLFFLVYPIINTLLISFMNASSKEFVGFDNYAFIFTSENMLIALRNNLLWIVFFTLITVVFGLILAVLTDRVKYEVAAKAIIFLPACISFVAAGIIWKFMYTYKPAGEPQIGTLNAVFTSVIPGFTPQAWLFNPAFNNWALIVVGIWIWTGFALVIFSASLKSIPADLLDAARIDGAGEITIFFKVILPLMSKTVTVVITYFVINVLKIFDIVYIMTNGNLDTEVIANRMYKEMFNFRNFGRASAIAVLLLVAVIPVVVMNIKRFSRGEEA
jgi:alpha-glucoside transport system permease protein